MPPSGTVPPRGSQVFDGLEFGPGVWTDDGAHVSSALAVKTNRVVTVTFRLYCFSNAAARAPENDPIILLPDALAPWDLNVGGAWVTSGPTLLAGNSVKGATYPREGLVALAAYKYEDEETFPTAIYSYEGGDESGMPDGTLTFVTEVVPSGPNAGQPEERIECRGSMTYIAAT